MIMSPLKKSIDACWLWIDSRMREKALVFWSQIASWTESGSWLGSGLTGSWRESPTVEKVRIPCSWGSSLNPGWAALGNPRAATEIATTETMQTLRAAGVKIMMFLSGRRDVEPAPLERTGDSEAAGGKSLMTRM